MFKAQTVDSILASFTKAANDLKALTERCTEQIEANHTKKLQLEDESVILANERSRAVAAAAKINALIS
jgi:hypothetical protein